MPTAKHGLKGFLTDCGLDAGGQAATAVPGAPESVSQSAVPGAGGSEQQRPPWLMLRRCPRAPEAGSDPCYAAVVEPFRRRGVHCLELSVGRAPAGPHGVAQLAIWLVRRLQPACLMWLRPAHGACTMPAGRHQARTHQAVLFRVACRVAGAPPGAAPSNAVQETVGRRQAVSIMT